MAAIGDRDQDGLERPAADAQCVVICVDVIDRDDEVVVRAAVAGYEKEDIEISNSTLTTKGETKKEEKGDYYRCELS